MFLVPLFFYAFFPLATPVTAQSMDWGCVMFGGIAVLATTYYVVRNRHMYTPPVLFIKRSEYEL